MTAHTEPTPGLTMKLTRTPDSEIDEGLLDISQTLRSRASGLRTQAGDLNEVLAASYRRRASELELEAWVAELQSGIPYDEVQSIAA